MSLSQVTIACPHCRREYDISIDLAKLARITSRASCARCKKVFEVTPERIQARTPSTRSSEHRREPPLGAREPSEQSRKRPLRRLDDERRDIRRPDDRDSVRRPDDDRRASDAGDGVESRTHSREFRRTESRTVSREFRRTDLRESRTDSRELRPLVHDSRRDTVELVPSDVLEAEVSVARTRSRNERPPEPRTTAPAPAPEPIDNDDEADMAWLVQADAGLGALTLQQSEGAVALEWLLTHAVGARREI